MNGIESLYKEWKKKRKEKKTGKNRR